MNNTIVGVDLAKEVIQVCVYTNHRLIIESISFIPLFSKEGNKTRIRSFFSKSACDKFIVRLIKDLRHMLKTN